MCSSGLSPAHFLPLESTVCRPSRSPPRPQVFNSLTPQAWRRHSLSFRLTSKQMSDDIHRDTYWFSLFRLRGESLAQIPICPWAEASGRARLRHQENLGVLGCRLTARWVTHFGFFSVWIKTCVFNLSERDVLLLPWIPREKKTLFTAATRRLPVTQWNNEEAETKQRSALAVVVNQWRFQPHFWHTLNLVSLFCLGSLQTGYSWQTAGNKSSHLTPKRREHEAQFKFRNKYDLAALDLWWKGDLAAERTDTFVCALRAEGVLQTEVDSVPRLLFHAACYLIKGDGRALSMFLSLFACGRSGDR